MPLVTLDQVSMAYGHLPLLDDATLKVDAGERVCIIGRNGTGKSTLLQILAGDVKPDGGAIWRQPGIGIARLVQDVPLVASRPVFDVVAEGLGSLGDLVADYHHAANEVATASIGLIAQRDVRTQYYVGLRYIDELNSAIGTFAINYQMTAKYSFGFRQSYNFADTLDVYSSATVQRRFDRFFLYLTVFNDSTTGDNGFGVGFFPEGLGRGLSSDALQNSFNKQR